MLAMMQRITRICQQQLILVFWKKRRKKIKGQPASQPRLTQKKTIKMV